MTGFTTEETAQRATYLSDEGDAKFVRDQYDLKLAEDKANVPITSPSDRNQAVAEDIGEQVSPEEGTLTA